MIREALKVYQQRPLCIRQSLELQNDDKSDLLSVLLTSVKEKKNFFFFSKLQFIIYPGKNFTPIRGNSFHKS